MVFKQKNKIEKNFNDNPGPPLLKSLMAKVIKNYHFFNPSHPFTSKLKPFSRPDKTRKEE